MPAATAQHKGTTPVDNFYLRGLVAATSRPDNLLMIGSFPIEILFFGLLTRKGEHKSGGTGCRRLNQRGNDIHWICITWKLASLDHQNQNELEKAFGCISPPTNYHECVPAEESCIIWI